MSELSTLQIADLVAFIFTLAVCFSWAHRRVREDFWYMINPLLYALHGSVFYAVVFANGYLNTRMMGLVEFHPSWSAILRLHSIVAMLGMVLFVISKRRINGSLSA